MTTFMLLSSATKNLNHADFINHSKKQRSRNTIFDFVFIFDQTRQYYDMLRLLINIVAIVNWEDEMDMKIDDDHGLTFMFLLIPNKSDDNKRLLSCVIISLLHWWTHQIFCALKFRSTFKNRLGCTIFIIIKTCRGVAWLSQHNLLINKINVLNNYIDFLCCYRVLARQLMNFKSIRMTSCTSTSPI